jgi:hypothetical protein
VPCCSACSQPTPKSAASFPAITVDIQLTLVTPRDAKGPVKVRITVPVQNGWKAIALSDGARQELFISTAMTREQLEAALEKAAAG